MACEVVPIATRTGGVPEVIEHGTSGYLADVGDVDTMARYAIELLSDESALRAMARRRRAVAQAASAPQNRSPVRSLLPAGRGALFVKARRYGHPLPAATATVSAPVFPSLHGYDRHPRRIAIQNLEPPEILAMPIPVPPHFRHPASGCRHSKPRRPLPQSPKPGVRQRTTQVDVPPSTFERQAVLD